MTDFPLARTQRFGDAPFFVFCDHASNAMPEDLNKLGLPDDILQTHIAWDIGAAQLAAGLARRLEGTLLCGGFSRLVIDPNRPETAPDLIPATSDGIPVPGNQMMTEEDRKQRIARFHRPYHERLGAALEEAAARAGPPFVISVHSFTNRMMGAAEERPWRAGVLWRQDEPSAKALIGYLRKATGWTVGDNQPYDARVFNYSVERHIEPRRLAHVTVEARQDGIGDAGGAEETAEILSAGVKAVAA